MSPKFQTHLIELPASAAGLRLDQALAVALPQYSRARLQRWIRSGAVRVAGVPGRPRDLIYGGEAVEVEAEFAPDERVGPEAIALDLLFEDPALLVLNKPAGMIVHPGAGAREHTLQNALLAHDPELARVPRAGLIHRLDKDTTGLLVVARTPEAHTLLAAAMQAREIEREYLALSLGTPTGGGTVDQPIGRHRSARTHMAVRADGRQAVTHYWIQERFRAHTLLRVRLETGRTHQIRVHLAHAGLPVVGDPVYGSRRQLAAGATPALNATLKAFPRQALHARRLAFTHPTSGEPLAFEAPLPADFQALLVALRTDGSELRP